MSPIGRGGDEVAEGQRVRGDGEAHVTPSWRVVWTSSKVTPSGIDGGLDVNARRHVGWGRDARVTPKVEPTFEDSPAAVRKAIMGGVGSPRMIMAAMP